MVKDVVTFRHAVAAWNFPSAAAAADRISAGMLGGARWMPGDELRDAAVFAKLHVGDPAGARVALDTLRRFSTRSPDDLRSRLLDAYVGMQEGNAATAAQ
jgi:hypothetical protein